LLLITFASLPHCQNWPAPKANIHTQKQQWPQGINMMQVDSIITEGFIVWSMCVLTTQVSELLNIAVPELCTPSSLNVLSLYSPEKTNYGFACWLVYWKKDHLLRKKGKKKQAW